MPKATTASITLPSLIQTGAMVNAVQTAHRTLPVALSTQQLVNARVHTSIMNLKQTDLLNEELQILRYLVRANSDHHFSLSV